MNRRLTSTLIALACLGLRTAHAGTPTKPAAGQSYVQAHLQPKQMAPQPAHFGDVVAAHIDARGGFYRSARWNRRWRTASSTTTCSDA